MSVLKNAIDMFFMIVIYMILARALMSWFIRSSSGTAYRIYMTIVQLTEPILIPCRKLLGRFGLYGTIDLSPIVAIIGLQILNGLIRAIL